MFGSVAKRFTNNYNIGDCSTALLGVLNLFVYLNYFCIYKKIYINIKIAKKQMRHIRVENSKACG